MTAPERHRAIDRAATIAALGHAGAQTPGASPIDDPADRSADAELARALTDDPDERVRAVALGALVRRDGNRQGTAPRPATTELWMHAIADSSARVRRIAAEVVPAGGFPAAPLLALLDDPDALVAEAAAFALGELGDDAVEAGAVGALAQVAAAPGHPDPLVREAAIAALGSLGHPDGLDAILAGCRDRPAVRRRAVLALAPFEGSAVDEAIERASVDKDWQVRQVAADLRGATGGGSRAEPPGG